MLLDKKRGVWTGKGQKAAHAGFAGRRENTFLSKPGRIPPGGSRILPRGLFLKEDEAR